jgi:hypothetical protein
MPSNGKAVAVATLFFVLLVETACSLLGNSAPTPWPTRDGPVIYSQDFEDPNVEFFSSYSDSMEAGPADGGYRLLLREAYYASDLPLILNERAFFPDDLIIEVDAAKKGGPKDSALMIVCRENENPDGSMERVEFEIFEDGTASAISYKGAEAENSAFDEVQKFGAPFHTGRAANRVHIECVGSEAVLYVNGARTLQIQTSILTGGVVHLGAATNKEGGAEYVYDNLVVKEVAP